MNMYSELFMALNIFYLYSEISEGKSFIMQEKVYVQISGTYALYGLDKFLLSNLNFKIVAYLI